MNNSVCSAYDSKLQCSVCKSANSDKINVRSDPQCSEYCIKNN